LKKSVDLKVTAWYIRKVAVERLGDKNRTLKTEQKAKRDEGTR
jgi:hypothetical protein